jgi:hypothetical protein
LTAGWLDYLSFPFWPIADVPPRLILSPVGGIGHLSGGRDMRHFFFGLFVFTAGAGAASAQQPVTVTSTGEFQKGNNEGLARVAQDQVARAPISAGSLEGWTGTGDPRSAASHPPSSTGRVFT